MSNAAEYRFALGILKLNGCNYGHRGYGKSVESSRNDKTGLEYTDGTSNVIFNFREYSEVI